MFRQVDVFDIHQGINDECSTYYHYELVSGPYAEVFTGDKFVVAIQSDSYNFYVLGKADGKIIDHVNKSVLFDFISFYSNSMNGSKK